MLLVVRRRAAGCNIAGWKVLDSVLVGVMRCAGSCLCSVLPAVI